MAIDCMGAAIPGTDLVSSHALFNVDGIPIRPITAVIEGEDRPRQQPCSKYRDDNPAEENAQTTRSSHVIPGTVLGSRTPFDSVPDAMNDKRTEDPDEHEA